MRTRHPTEWTLSEAARLLDQPQHRLIYLCEKQVVHPDVEDARGRGSSRRFSARNLLEFAVALRLRALELPASAIGAITFTLRAFERRIQQEIDGFCLPTSLRGPGAPDLRIILSDGRLYVTLGTNKNPTKAYGGIEFRHLGGGKASQHDLQRALTLLPSSKRSDRSAGNGHASVSGSSHARVEISVTRIAQELPLEG